MFSFIEQDRVSGFWTWMFVMSKVIFNQNFLCQKIRNFQESFNKFNFLESFNKIMRFRCQSLATQYSLFSENSGSYFSTGKQLSQQIVKITKNFSMTRYHHVTVLIYCWYSFSEYTAPARWFVVMNFVVHALMYTYYAFKALRYLERAFVILFLFFLSLLVIGIESQK